MNEQDTGFRTQIIGGFQRDDVLKYIEQTSRSFTEKIEELKKDLEEANNQIEEQRARADEEAAKSSELSDKDAELLERLGAMTLSEDTLRNTLADTQADLDAQIDTIRRLTEENDALRAENAKLTSEIAELAGEITGLQSKCQEYEAAKEHMAEIELRAYRQAKALERKGIEESERIKRETAAVVEEYRQKLCSAGDDYRFALLQAQEEFSNIYQRTCALLDSLDTAVLQLRREETASLPEPADSQAEEES